MFTGNVRVGPKAYGPGTSALDAIWDAVDAEFPGVGNCCMSKDGLFTLPRPPGPVPPGRGRVRDPASAPSATPPLTSLDEDTVPISELEWTNGHDNLFNAATATPQGVGTGIEWRPLDPELDDIRRPVRQGRRLDHRRTGCARSRSTTCRPWSGSRPATTASMETKLFATYYVDNYQQPEPRISRMVFKSRRPGNTNGPALWNHLCKVEISDLLTVQTSTPAAAASTTTSTSKGSTTPAGPAAPTTRSSSSPWICHRGRTTPRNPFDADSDP